MASGLENIETIESPFRRFVTTIGVFPTAFTDAMTYYECLAYLVKYLENTVIPAVNENAEALEELQTLYVQLKSYVDNYFENLDVQEEINNKLDQMVADGSFQTILNTYVQPKLDELDNKIDTEIENESSARISTDESLQNQISGLASGSPLVASDVSGMTNTSRIYVNTSDGKWYYYDGDSWEIGGTYQSTGIGENSVLLSNLNNDLENSFEASYDQETSYESGYQSGKYVNTSGVITSYAVGACLSVDVNPKETYVFNSYYNTTIYQTTNNLYVILDSEDNIVQHEVISETTNGVLTRTITIPTDGAKLIINTTNMADGTLSNHFGITLFKVDSYIQKNKINYNQFDDIVKTLFKETYTDFDNSNLETFANNALMTAGQNVYDQPGGYTLYKLDVTGGEKYKFHIYKFYNNVPIFAGSKDCIFSSTTQGGVTYQVHGNCARFNAEGNNAYVDIDVTVPDGADVLYINSDNSKTLTIKKFTKLDVDMESQGDVLPNPLNGKVLLFNGDSVSSSTATTDSQITTPIAPENNRAWVARVQLNNPTCTCYGYAVHGSTIAKRDGYTNSILERTATMYAEHSNADYIILEGGINDVFVNVPLGIVSSGYNAVLDDTTFCGALESLFKYAQSNWQGKKIGFINLYKVPIASGQASYSEKVIEICKKWQVPVLNLYDDSDLNFYIDDIAANFSQITELAPNGDKLHPNSAGYNVLQNRIESWIKSL